MLGRFARQCWLFLFCVSLFASGADAKPAARPRVAFFGSSTTAGVGVHDPKARYSTLVSRKLGWTEINLGLSGSPLSRGEPHGSDPAGVDRIDALLATKPDIVVFMYGTIDAASHIKLADFKRDAATSFQRLAGVKTIVLLPQPNKQTAGSRAPYDDALHAAAAAAHLPCIDTAGAFPATELDALSADSYHLNERGHAKLARFLVPLLRDAARP